MTKVSQPTIPAEYKELSDEELVRRYASKGEHFAFSCLFYRYSHLVYGICLKYLNDVSSAKDAMQQVFIKLLEDLKKHDIDRFKPWLYQVSKNHCLMQLRKKSPEVSSENIGDLSMEFEEEWHHKIEEDKLLDELDRAVKELSMDQRKCIEFFYLQKMSYAEVSRQTGYDLNKVKSAIQNGKRNIKNRLEALVKVKA